MSALEQYRRGPWAGTFQGVACWTAYLLMDWILVLGSSIVKFEYESWQLWEL
ncbi:hypothetical protein DL95DRAFT_383352, partial [Leptodontidium sp. 2 PMI_412]